jgi:beta-lactamase class A
MLTPSRMTRCVAPLLVAAALAAPVLQAQGRGPAAEPPARQLLAQQFRAALGAIVARTPGITGVAVTDFTSGEQFGWHGTTAFPQGSAIKIPILVELFRQAEAGTIALDERVPVRTADEVGGTGVAQWFGDGTSLLSWRDLATLMIVLSDNTATNLLIDRLGMASVNATMASLGVGDIRLQRKMIRPLASARGEENVATPDAAVALLERIHRCTLPMARARCDALRRILEIPKDGPLPASVPVGVKVAWKPGSVEGVETAWGIVALEGRPYALAVMATYTDATSGQRAIRDVADAAYAHFHRVARATAYGVRVPLSLADSLRVPPP